LTKFLIL